MDNPLRGVAFLVGATLLFSISDAMAKLLGRDMPAIEIAWIRYIVFATMAIGMARRGGRLGWRVQSPALQILRGLGVVISGLCFIIALRTLPLADAASISFMSPLMITVLSVLILAEVVGWRRWLAVLVGLTGVLIVMRPGLGAFQPAALWVVASASSWALATVLARKLNRTDAPHVTVLWSALSGLAALTLLLPFDVILPSPPQLLLAVLLGIVASGGQILLVQGYRYGSASMLAPFTYVQLLWSTSLGWLVFGAWPDHYTLLGTGIIIASGLYSAQYERQRAAAREVSA